MAKTIRTTSKAAPKIPTEHSEQVSLMQWVEWFHKDKSAYIYAVPNGGLRNPIVAVRLKAEGVKAGFPDIGFAQARGGYFGLYIELKRLKQSRTSDEQHAWHDRLEEQGYCVRICKGFEEGKAALLWYWSLPSTNQVNQRHQDPIAGLLG